ncbi:MAG TPA: toll/interleukin-1 receptor domain-containing protein, partial [Ktedonobacterales bacterium]
MADEQLNIFISYSRADSAFVDRLEADLRARGYTVWVDRRRLEGGQIWEQEIDAAIARCNLFLLVLSPSAVNSIYVRHEFEESERLGKRLIPIVWQAQGLVIPTWLAAADNRQRQDFTNPNAYVIDLKRLLYAIE